MYRACVRSTLLRLGKPNCCAQRPRRLQPALCALHARALQQQDAAAERAAIWKARRAGGTRLLPPSCPHRSTHPCSSDGRWLSAAAAAAGLCGARARALGVRMGSGRALSRPSDRADGGGDASTSGSGSERLSHKLLAPLWRVSAALARQGSADNTILAGTLARTAAQARAAAALPDMLAAR
jgi:hypothetical protein